MDELRRRGVVRTGLVYVAGAFALLEFADIAFPRLGLPDGAVDVVLWVGLSGFPIALIASWGIEVRAGRDTGQLRSWLSPTTLSIAAVFVALGIGMGFFWGGTGGTSSSLAESPAAPHRGEHAPAERVERATEQRRSVAVLPFENISGDATNEPFTIGIHDDLVTQISRISSIKTISRTSVLQYRDTTKTIPQIAGELGVATILEGGVQRSGDRVRINAQLIDASTDEHLWSETYDRQLTAVSIFAIQSEIAMSVAESLRATLTRDEERRITTAPSQNLVAVESYFLGKQLLERRNRESLLAAVEYFKQVVELDPSFALGHSGLADAYMLLPEYVPGTDWLIAWEKSEAAAKRALVLDPDLPEALTSMGWNRLIHYYDWKEAEALLRRALKAQSNNTNALHWLSHVLSWQGQSEEAITVARLATEVDPNSRLMARNLSYILTDAGEFEASIALAHETIRRYPDQFEQLGELWLTYLRASRPEAATEYLVKWAAHTGRDEAAARQIAHAFILHGQTGEPQRLPQELVDRVKFGSEDLGQVYAFLGDAKNALSSLEQAYEERSGSRSVLSMKLNPAYDFIREDPRFRVLVKKAGLGN